MTIDITMFLGLLFGFSAVSALVTEAVKKITADKDNLSKNLIAIGMSMIIGIGGTAVYYLYSGTPYNVNTIVYMVLMGLASSLTSMVGYDKVKQVIEQIAKKA